MANGLVIRKKNASYTLGWWNYDRVIGVNRYGRIESIILGFFPREMFFLIRWSWALVRVVSWGGWRVCVNKVAAFPCIFRAKKQTAQFFCFGL
jgi:hypothetical protein